MEAGRFLSPKVFGHGKRREIWEFPGDPLQPWDWLSQILHHLDILMSWCHLPVGRGRGGIRNPGGFGILDPKFLPGVPRCPSTPGKHQQGHWGGHKEMIPPQVAMEGGDDTTFPMGIPRNVGMGWSHQRCQSRYPPDSVHRGRLRPQLLPSQSEPFPGNSRIPSLFWVFRVFLGISLSLCWLVSSSMLICFNLHVQFHPIWLNLHFHCHLNRVFIYILFLFSSFYLQF